MSLYYRPIPQTDPARPDGALSIAGGWVWFDRIEVLRRGAEPQIIPAADLPDAIRDRLTAPRAPLADLNWGQPRLMGILNVTPDSFSDGGQHFGDDAAVRHAHQLIEVGADILDVGGESTRPGAIEVPVDQERSRTVPVIEAIRRSGAKIPISIDTRKAGVARAALDAGADILNDVSAFTFDPEMAALAQTRDAPVCLMHAQGDPQTMQAAPQYEDVLLDVYDFLEERIRSAERQGVTRTRIIVDPGIGFGKTADHNLALIRRLSLFHTLGCVVLLGASRKRFIGTIGGTEQAAQRVSGSVAIALEAARQGVQILRVHDIEETRQALALWRAVTT